CKYQIRNVPSSKATAAPISGLILKSIARPSPGSAMCATTSPARLIRFINAKLPTSPAASAVSSISRIEYDSEAFTVEADEYSGLQVQDDCDDRNRPTHRISFPV